MSANPLLFRPESLDAQRFAWLGRPMILRGISATIFASFSVVFVIAIGLFLGLGEYTRQIRAIGVILPIDGLARLVAPHAGWVTDLKVREGDDVKKGDVLYVLSIDSTTALGDTQAAVAKILQEKQRQLTDALVRQDQTDAMSAQDLRDQAANIEKELAQVDSEIKLFEDITQQMAEFADRQQVLLSRGIAVTSEYEQRIQALNTQRAQLAELHRTRIELAAKLAESQDQLRGADLRAQTQKAQIQQRLLDVEQQISESEANRELQITAPRDGTITGVNTLPGQTVELGTPLLTIIPKDRPLVAQLLVPGSGIGFVREGSNVLLRYQAFPYQKFGQYSGSVSLISRASLRPEEISLLNAGDAEARAGTTFYRITVQPNENFVLAYGHSEPLQAGMQVEAHVLVDTRTLFQWIFEPVYSLRGSLSVIDKQARP